MNHLKILSVVFFLLLSLTACSSHKTAMIRLRSDASIQKELQMRYLKDKYTKDLPIQILSTKGIVSLEGQADSQAQRNRAIEIAETQKGVNEVKSYLIVRDYQDDERYSKDAHEKN